MRIYDCCDTALTLHIEYAPCACIEQGLELAIS